MAIAKIIQARDGDTLCGIAADAGFRDCKKLRDANSELQTRPVRPGDQVKIPEVTQKTDSGNTELRHRFRRPGKPVASVRFVHGSPNLSVENDATLTELNVSNYATDKAGADRKQNFVNDTHRTFDADADADIDTFKLEVRDPRTKKAKVPVELEMKRPVYDAKGKLTSHTDFPGSHKDATTERGKRSLDTEADQMPSSKRFRTCYLRLVVDPEDQAARPKQTILATHMIESTPVDEKVEILDQTVVGAYLIETCPIKAPEATCRVSAEVPVCAESRQKRVRTRVHILRPTRTGNGVVQVDDARKGCLARVRELYAQAHMGLHLLEEPRLVPPPAVGSPGTELEFAL